MTTSTLLGRSSEFAALDQLVASVREGLSGALVMRGEARVGNGMGNQPFAERARRELLATGDTCASARSRRSTI